MREPLDPYAVQRFPTLAWRRHGVRAIATPERATSTSRVWHHSSRTCRHVVVEN
jgi:hypothetical protein